MYYTPPNKFGKVVLCLVRSLLAHWSLTSLTILYGMLSPMYVLAQLVLLFRDLVFALPNFIPNRKELNSVIHQHTYDSTFKNREIWERYEKYADELLAALDPEPLSTNFKRRNEFLRETINRQRMMHNLTGKPFNSDLFLSDKVYLFNKDSKIANISNKGIFIQGKFDRSVSVKSTEEFANLSSQVTTLFIYNSSGHNPSYTERERFISDVKNYLNKL